MKFEMMRRIFYLNGIKTAVGILPFTLSWDCSPM